MAAKKANCVLVMIKRNIKCKNAAIIMRLYKSLVRPRLEFPYRFGLLIIRRILKFWKEYKNGLQKRATKWFMGLGT